MLILRLEKILAPLVLIFSLCLALWKCRYGFDPGDEPYSYFHAFKLARLGETLIANEFNNALTHHDLINRVLLGWAPFDVLFLRQLSNFTFFGLLLLLATPISEPCAVMGWF